MEKYERSAYMEGYKNNGLVFGRLGGRFACVRSEEAVGMLLDPVNVWACRFEDNPG
jgi:hypothetical protein